MTVTITAEYVFRHSESRVYCLVKLRNLLEQTSLWMRGVVLRVLDSSPTYHVVRVSGVYDDLITREWKPHEMRQLLFELALRPGFVAVEATLHHSVQVEVFYSNWQMTYVPTREEDRVVLRLTHPNGSASAQGERVETNTEGVQGLRKEATDSSRGYDAAAAAIKRSCDTLAGASPDSASSRLCQGVLPRILSTASSATRKSDGTPDVPRSTDAEVHYEPAALAYLSASCNAYYGPSASFRSTHLCLFRAAIQVEPTWATQDGAAVDCAYPTAGLSNMSGGALGATAAEPTSDAAADRPREFAFVAGEPVRFCVRLHPLAHNWPEGTDAADDFFVELQCDPAQWMVIGKKRTRRMLSASEDVAMYFTALPLLPEDTGVGPSHSPDGRRRVGTRQSRSQVPTELVDRAAMGKDILRIPTIRVFRAPPREGSGSEAPRCDTGADGKDEVLVDVVRFRRWARVTKKVR